MALPSEHAARKRLRRLAAAPDPGTPDGREQQLGEMRELSESIKAAEHHAVVAAVRARKAAAMTTWAQTPPRPRMSTTRSRTRGGNDPAHWEALKKVAYLLRNGMPHPLSVDDLAHGRLSPKETDELLDLTQRGIRGGQGFSAKDAERQERLLEKACDRPGAVQWVRDNLVNVDGRWERKSDSRPFEPRGGESNGL